MGTIRVNFNFLRESFNYEWFKVIRFFSLRDATLNTIIIFVFKPFRDLYGSIGTPSIMSRTIIVGTDVNTVRRILFVLSYFIRCNEVYERMEHMISTESQSEEQVDPENNNIDSKSSSSEGASKITE